MRIALVYLSGGGLSGGAMTTLRQQVPRLRAHRDVDELHVMVPPGADLDAGLGKADVWPVGSRKSRLAYLRRWVDEKAPDVVYIPNAAWFDAGDVPTVCMVRNTEPILRPFGANTVLQGVKNVLRARMFRQACHRATRVIAVSQYVRDLIADRWHVPDSKIGVVYHGVNTPSAPSEARFRPAEPFWLVAGSIIPYRGLEDAIGALARRPSDERLMIAGASVYSTAYEKKMKALAQELGLTERVVWLGQISASELSWRYRQCLAFVMTSRLEACPNVVLESLAHGCASISTNCAPMPEFYRDLAHYYVPGDVTGLVSRMEEVRSGLKRYDPTPALRRARDFSWDKNIEALLGELRQAAGGGG